MCLCVCVWGGGGCVRACVQLDKTYKPTRHVVRGFVLIFPSVFLQVSVGILHDIGPRI